ncbi:hypothetical protein FBY40_3406 [Microbacterium sp. SLBN-154]|nr:hypothetical protein FBY40_3406 [Microbacterium sp. SLBN-154]
MWVLLVTLGAASSVASVLVYAHDRPTSSYPFSSTPSDEPKAVKVLRIAGFFLTMFAALMLASSTGVWVGVLTLVGVWLPLMVTILISNAVRRHRTRDLSA